MKRTNRVATTTACILLCATALVACSSGPPELTKESAIFDGLDPVVVQEVLENPVAMDNIEMEDEVDARDSMAQGIVANFMTCRDVARVYEEWSTTGAPPAFAPWPEPTTPLAWYRWEPGQRERLQGAVDSGDIEALRIFVTSENGCGNWIPAAPGDVNGPTIRDHILGQG